MNVGRSDERSNGSQNMRRCDNTTSATSAYWGEPRL
jgi:hypothetical protein